MNSGREISIAITNFNRYGFVIECLEHVVGDPRVAEIVINDDASTDGCHERLQEYYKDRLKVRFYQNSKNVDCYVNKAIAVENCSCDWVVLFDSDNIMPVTYLDRLFELALWNPSTAYLPDFAKPHFDYREFAGMTVKRENVARLMQRPHFATMLNTANYFFKRDEYLRVWDGSVNPHTADSIYQNYNWLKADNRLHVVAGMRYEHRVHPDSHFKKNNAKTGSFAQEVERNLKALT